MGFEQGNGIFDARYDSDSGFWIFSGYMFEDTKQVSARCR
jgi:hypothetical protein